MCPSVISTVKSSVILDCHCVIEYFMAQDELFFYKHANHHSPAISFADESKHRWQTVPPEANQLDSLCCAPARALPWRTPLSWNIQSDHHHTEGEENPPWICFSLSYTHKLCSALSCDWQTSTKHNGIPVYKAHTLTSIKRAVYRERVAHLLAGLSFRAVV